MQPFIRRRTPRNAKNTRTLGAGARLRKRSRQRKRFGLIRGVLFSGLVVVSIAMLCYSLYGLLFSSEQATLSLVTPDTELQLADRSQFTDSNASNTLPSASESPDSGTRTPATTLDPQKPPIPTADSAAPKEQAPSTMPAAPLVETEANQPLLQSSIVHKVKRGETLGAIVRKYGFENALGNKLYAALRNAKDQEKLSVHKINVGQELEFVLGPDGKVAELRTDKGPEFEVVVAENESGEFVAKVSRLPSEMKKVTAVGTIEKAFSVAATQAGMSYEVIDDVVDIFGDRVAFHRDFRVGDRFVVNYSDKILSDGTSVGSGPILGALFEVNKKRYFAIRYVGKDNKARHFDNEGQLLGRTFLRYPLKFSRISSLFSKSRLHPILKRRRPHNGVDFAAPTGTPVRSVSDGTITYAGWKGGGGKTVKIQHTDRYSTAYLHLSRISRGIRRGAKVKRGQVIGAVGSTGLSTGPHLHFSFYDRGRYVDPLKIKLPTVEKLTKGTKIDKKFLKEAINSLEKQLSVELESTTKDPSSVASNYGNKIRYKG